MNHAPTDRRLKVPTRAVAWNYRHSQRLWLGSSHILYALAIKALLIISYALPILYVWMFPESGMTVLRGEPILWNLDTYAAFFLFFVIPTQFWIVFRAIGTHDRKWWTKYIVVDIFLTWLAFSFMAVMVVGAPWSIFLFLLPLLWFAGTTRLMYGRSMRVGL